MTELRRRPSAQQIAVSTLLAVAIVCLLAGAVMSVISAVKAADDPAATIGESMLMTVLALLLYGPMIVLTAWPVSIPVVLGLGVGLAYWRSRQRYRRDRNPVTTARVVLVVLLGYVGAICLTWLVLLVTARGRG